MEIEQVIQYLAAAALPILFAITLHEAAHGYVARHFGDTTAERAGRISLNPLRHIDPVGTILVPIVTLDGGRIAVSLLPYRHAIHLARIEPYGMFILIILLSKQVLGLILWPVAGIVIAAIKFVFGL